MRNRNNETAKAFPSRGKVLRDPVHNLIVFHPGDEYLLDLINCPEFQRLRRIKQLGVSSITYSGAEHTRFSHSIGVLAFASRILARLKERHQRNASLIRLIVKHERMVKSAALLHDIGHAPFSHMLERAFVSTASHERRTAELIRSSKTNINRCLRQHTIDPEAVCSIIDGTMPIRFLCDIVSSQLDADRMDYLLRDSLMTGVAYGRCDPDWIIYSMCLGLDPSSSVRASLKNLRLSLDLVRGLHAAEQLIIARMHMSLQVYYHRVTRGWEAHLLCLFKLAGQLAEKDKLPRETPKIVRTFFTKKGALSCDEFLLFDEPSMLHAFSLWANAPKADSRLADLSQAFLRREKRFYSKEFTKDSVTESFRLVEGLVKEGAREGIDFYHDEANFRGYKDFGRSVAQQNSKEEPDTVASEAIFLADDDILKLATPVEHHPHALVTPALSNKAEKVPLNRVFIHRDFYKK